MASLCLLSVLCIVLLCSAEAAQRYQVVSACPWDENSWKMESNRKNCQEPTPDYLCAAMENWVGHFGEICTKYGLSPANKCPVLNNLTYNLDSVDCKAPSNCPDTPYSPGELWKYQICYGDFYGTTPTPAITTMTEMTTTPPLPLTKTQSERPDDCDSGGAAVAVLVVVVLILIAVIVVLCMYIRNQWGFKDRVKGWRSRLPFGRGDESTGTCNEDVEAGPTESESLLQSGEERAEEKQNNEDLSMYSKVKKDKSKTTDKIGSDKSAADPDAQHQRDNDDAVIMKRRIENLKILQKYLVHILKKEISVTDLKEMSIIHSKSLTEHFSEPLLKDLQNVKTSDDYSQLDMSLVFVFLGNFCPNIKPPSEEWYHEPQNTDETIGADIERIRQMWNEYCDNHCKFEKMDDVFNRMKHNYGELAVEKCSNTSSNDREGFEDVKDKIQSIKLNPDCVVEDGIVITEGVKTALQLLTTNNVVICRGAIGCGKTHVLRAIQKNYEEKGGWKLRWMEETLLEENHDEKTLVVCDNMFGRFGCNTFSSNEILKIENLLKKILGNQDGKIKVAIGIHQHVFEEVNTNSHLTFLQNNNITVDLNKPTESETLLIFKEQQKRGHCCQDPNCWFRNIDFASVSAKLSLNQGLIGSPFLSWMYCCHHELFSDDVFSKSPIENLLSRFEKMKTDTRKLYYSLVYIMCVGKHSGGNKLESFAGQIQAELTTESVDNVIRSTPGYFVHVDKNTVTLVHEVLTIALFKAVAKAEEDLRHVYQNCEIETILQLTRPADELQSEFACGFHYPQRKNPARDLGKRLVRRCIIDADGKKWFSVDHPLNKHRLFTEKYNRYSKKK